MTSDPRDTFLEEAAELLVQLETTLLNLEAAPLDADLVATAFRALHTIKGSGSMFGFERLAAFTHHLENAFDLVRKGELAASPALINIALDAKDHIRALVESPETIDDGTEQRLLSAIGTLVNREEIQPTVIQPAARAVSDKDAFWRIRFGLPFDALERGANPLLLLDELRGLGTCTITAITDSVPPLAEINPCVLYVRWDILLTTAEPRSAIEDVFIFVVDEADLRIEPVVSESRVLGDILVDRGAVTPEEVDAALSTRPLLGEILVESGVLEAQQVQSALAEQHHVRGETDKRKTPPASASIRVPAERLDSLMDQVGELVIAQARLKQLVQALGDSPIKSVAEDIERLSNGLRDITMGIRTVPIGTLFERFRRLVRDISQDLGKDVQLELIGEDTELDKTVIERLSDPLIHIVRNSMDHGIESPADRGQAGKSRQGHLRLTAMHAGAKVCVRVGDDGRGLNRDRIRAKAIESGLIPADATLSDSEIYQMIFHPGFSTAREVTSLSGRGVGMDVVKRTIESLRGTVDISSVAGQGTEITLNLPLTLAIIDGLLVRVGTGRYVIPLTSVEECVELTARDERSGSGPSFLNIRGELIPFIRLRESFNVLHPADLYQKVVIVTVGNRRVGLVVDQVIGEHQTVIKSLSKLHADVHSFSGATILGDGGVALIIDVNVVAVAETRVDAPRPPIRHAS